MPEPNSDRPKSIAECLREKATHAAKAAQARKEEDIQRQKNSYAIYMKSIVEWGHEAADRGETTLILDTNRILFLSDLKRLDLMFSFAAFARALPYGFLVDISSDENTMFFSW
jgi:hypothetical protein